MKKVISLILIISILSGSCLAMGATGTNMSETVNAIGLTKAQMADIAASLQAVEQDKVNFGMEDVDFSSLMLGNEILAYEYTVDGLSQLDFSFIPVMSGSEIVALVLKDGFGASAITKQIGTALVSELNSVVSDNDEIAIIYDTDGCNVFNGVSAFSIAAFENSDASRANLSSITRNVLNAYGISLSRVVSKIPIPANATVSYSSNRTKLLPITLVSQEYGTYYNLCWAAAMSMVGEFHTEIELSIETIARALHGTDFDYGAETYEYQSLYETLYEFDTAICASPDEITESYIRLKINSDIPLHASFVLDSPNRLYHSAVIYGITSGGSIYIRDPMDASVLGYYSSQTGYLTYVTPYTGYHATLESVTYNSEIE